MDKITLATCIIVSMLCISLAGLQLASQQHTFEAILCAIALTTHVIMADKLELSIFDQ